MIMEDSSRRKSAQKKGTKPSCNQNGRMNICTGCNEPIEDRFLMKVVDEPWHEGCLQCCICGTTLSRSCFSKDRKLYCRSDYEKVYGTKCSGCTKAIPSNEFVMRALGNVYHLKCFDCTMCGHRLEKGEEFGIKENKLYCKEDFAKLSKVTTSHGSKRKQQENVSNNSLPAVKEVKGECTGDNSDSDDSSALADDDSDDKKGPKRPRTILTSQQRKVFKSAFEISSKPCRKVREELSRETGLSVRVVQVWFQNQRAKIKKLARRNNPESEGAASCRVTGRQRIKKGKDGKGSSPRDKRRPDREGLDLPHDVALSPPAPLQSAQAGPYGMIPPPQYQQQVAMMPPQYHAPYQAPMNPADASGEMGVDHTMPSLDECMLRSHQFNPQDMSGYTAVTSHNGWNAMH